MTTADHPTSVGRCDLDSAWRYRNLPRHAAVGDPPGVGWIAAVVLAVAAHDLFTNLLVPDSLTAVWNVLFAISLVAVLRWRVCSSEELGLANRGLGSGLRVGLVAAAVVAVFIAVVVAIPATREFFVTDEIRSDDTVERAINASLRIPFGTAMSEELVFRGALLALLLRRQTVRTAIITSSLLFGIWHLVPGAETADDSSLLVAAAEIAGTVLVTGIAGVVFAWLRLRGRHVLAPILAHTATNTLGYVGAIVAIALS